MTINVAIRRAAFELWLQGKTYTETARLLSISTSSVSNFVHGDDRYLGAIKERGLPGSSPRSAYRKVPNPYQAAREARLARGERFFAEYLQGDTLQEIANREGVSRQRVEQILNRHQPYKDLRHDLTNPKVDLRELSRLWLRGHNNKALAKHLEISVNMVEKLVATLPLYEDLKDVRPRYSDASKVQLMVDMYNAGSTLAQIRDHFGYRSVGLNAVWPMMSAHPDYRPRPKGFKKGS